jgi:LPS sulfotransferase NodH
VSRLILLAHARSGSDLVCWLLKQHRRIRMRHELFIEGDEVRQTFPIGGRYLQRDEDGAAFLRDVVWTQPGYDVLGFKLLVDHARSGRWTSAWDELGADRELLVVQLERRDLLATYVSHSIASVTGQWHAAVGEPVLERPPFPVQLEELRQFVGTLRNQQADAKARFAHHRRLELVFERDLEHGVLPSTTRRIFEFVGVEPVPFTPPTRRTAIRPIAEQVANYEELRRALVAAGEWESITGQA